MKLSTLKKLSRPAALLAAIALIIIAAARHADVSAEESTAVAPLFSYSASDTDASIPANAARVSLEGSAFGSGITLDGDSILITKPGAYILGGSSNGRRVVVDADKKDTVRLILDNASISYEGGAAIYARKAGSVVIVLPDGSSSEIRGGLPGKSEASDESDSESAQTAIYAKNNLIITGGGSLTIESGGHGAWAKDYLVITGGELSVTAALDGLRGSDGVAINGGSVTIASVVDGIKSTKTSDATKGFVQIDNGTFNITSANDGIQAESTLLILGGSGSIVSGGGAGDAQPVEESRKGGWDGMFAGQPAATTDETPSTKGLKAGSAVAILGGEYEINALDDGIHSNGSIEIISGAYTIRTGDDGLHADGALLISDGTINVLQSYEGVEGAAINISGGDITVRASDDAINLADGTASQRGFKGGFMGGASMSGMTMHISGGTLRAYGGRDTLDANGDIVLTGGAIYLSGQSQGMDGAIDYDGSLTVTGGSFITAGSVLGASEKSTQPVFLVSYTQQVASGSTIELRDAATDKVILTYASDIACTMSGFTSPELQQGQSISIWINGEKRIDATLGSDSYITGVSEDGSDYNTMNGRGMGGGRGGQMTRPDGNWRGQPPAMPQQP